MSDHDAEGADALLHDATLRGCAESRTILSRRGMLGLTAGLFSSAMLPRSAFASQCGSRDPRMLLVVLRGGMDGLAALAPIGDSFYVTQRDKLAYDRATPLLPVSGGGEVWGLHSAFKTIHAEYKAGNVAFVHSVAPPLRNRSHFDCQESLENGNPEGVTSRDGWLNRYLQDPGNCFTKMDPTRAIQIGRTPLVIRGAAPTLGWTPSELASPSPETQGLIMDLYKHQGDTRLLETLRRGLDGQKKAVGAFGSTTPSVERRDDPCVADQNEPQTAKESLIVYGFRGAGNLLKSNGGPRIATLNFDGWDTHTDEFQKDCPQGTSNGLGFLFSQLDMGVNAFKKAIGDAWNDTVVVVVTEFGRMVLNNGNLGSDHGTGALAMLIGGAVKGGKVTGEWPTLAKLEGGRDLIALNDLRSVFKGVLVQHFGVVDTPSSKLNTYLFPGSLDGKAPAKTMPDLIKA